MKLFGYESGEILKLPHLWLVSVLLVESVKKNITTKLVSRGLTILSGRQYVYLDGFIGFSGRWTKINKSRIFIFFFRKMFWEVI